MVDDAQGTSEWLRGLGLVAGHQRAQDAVVDLAVEDREAQAVGSQGIEVAVRDPGEHDCLSSGDCNTTYCNYLKSAHTNTAPTRILGAGASRRSAITVVRRIRPAGTGSAATARARDARRQARTASPAARNAVRAYAVSRSC